MRSFEKERNRLNPAQKRAVELTEGPVLIIAGPGTGKTQLLAVRVAHILSQGAVLPHNILCLTFTDSGQAAMRERLLRFIGNDAYQVTISTYHAFGNELIRRYPEYVDNSAHERPIDDLLQDEILRAVLDAQPYSNPLKNNVYLRDIRSLISDAKRALHTPDDLRAIAKQNQKFIETVNPAIAAHLQDFTSMSKARVAQFAAIIEILDKTPPSSLGKIITSELNEALEQAAETGLTTPLTKWKNNWLVKDTQNRFNVDGLRTCRRLNALADIYEQYESALEIRSVFDYDDMILRAVRALEQNDDFKYTLQEQYQYILLDEFQDTNGAQLRLIELLTDNPVNERRPNILAVGDDDQAIYAFQGASYSNMRKFLELYDEPVIIPLTDNYRSHHDILHIAEKVAEQINDRLHTSITDVEKKLVAVSKQVPASATIECRELLSDVAEYAWVSAKIEELVAKGTLPSEIAVLAPKHAMLEMLVPYLHNRGIGVRYEKRENVLDDKFIKEIITMSRLCVALNSDESLADALWPEVLSYDCWGVHTETIWDISWQTRSARVPWRTIIMQTESVKFIGLFFTRLSHLAHNETLEQMLDYLVGRAAVTDQEKSYTSPFYECHFGEAVRQNRAGDFWQMLMHFTVLRKRLGNYQLDEDRPLLLADFMTFIDAHRSAGIKIMSTIPFRDNAESVQLMTAYKAKGLEFDAVFVLGCQDEVWGTKAKNHTSLINLPKNLQHIRYRGGTADERLRLFFVAITRARHQLYLTNHRTTYAGKPTTRLQYLQVVEMEHGSISQVLPQKYQLVLTATTLAPDSIDDIVQYWQTKHLTIQPHLSELLAPRLERLKLSPSHINTFLDPVYGGPEAFFLRSVLYFPQAPSLDSVYGSALHATIEWLHNQQVTESLPSIAQATKYLAEHITAKRLSKQSSKQLIERGQSALDKYLPVRSAEFLKTDLHEVDFSSAGVMLGIVPLTGKIDKLRINKSSRTITVTDFKSGRAYAVWKNDPKLIAYKRQLYMYKFLVEHAPAYQGYQVDQGILEFIEPDEDGVVQTLILNYNDQEAQTIKLLISAVWQHIQAMSFPAITYKPTAAGIHQFEQDLIHGVI